MKLLLSIAGAALSIPLALSFTAPASMVAPAPAAVPAAAWSIDATHSSVIFRVLHMGVANFYGRFNSVSGTVTLDDANPSASKVELTIPIESIDTNSKGRDGHLKSPDFFNAKEFPEVKFVSKTVSKAGDKEWKIEGEMTMHGVTKPMTIQARQMGVLEGKNGKVAGFDVQFTLKRSDFGMTFMLEGIGDEVAVMAGFECKAQ